MTLDRLASAAQAERLAVLGAFHTSRADGAGDGTLVLLGPDEPGFWPHVTAACEFADGAPDPLDRWSERVISHIARDLDGTAFFPFGDPPRPFITWALKGGACFVSPVTLLVHTRAGLFVSFRGAILLAGHLPLPDAPPNPCDTCDGKPCLTACPAGALTGGGYDLDGCHAFLDTGPGADCLSQGCAVRRSCPAGAGYHRLAAQSAYHMERFHPCPSL